MERRWRDKEWRRKTTENYGRGRTETETDGERRRWTDGDGKRRRTTEVDRRGGKRTESYGGGRKGTETDREPSTEVLGQWWKEPINRWCLATQGCTVTGFQSGLQPHHTFGLTLKSSLITKYSLAVPQSPLRCWNREIIVFLKVGFFFLINKFIYFWLHWVFVAARAFSSCSERGPLFPAVRGLLIAVASPVVEHELCGSAACGILLDP